MRGDRIAFIENRKIAIVAERVAFLAQDSRARRMKRADPRLRRASPTSVATRSRISLAALLVNVTASISNGDALRSAMMWAIR